MTKKVLNKARGVFVTGTDTGTGKTFVTTNILAWLRLHGVNAAAMKPIACGDGREDAEIYWELMEREVPLDIINPVWLRKPLAPMVASRIEKREINLDTIFAAYKLLAERYSVVLIEGAGGLLVPITSEYLVADMAADFGLPLLVVAANRLGVLSHTLMTLECARQRDLDICGIVLNSVCDRPRGMAERTNKPALEQAAKTAVIAVPFCSKKIFKKSCGQKNFSVQNVRPLFAAPSMQRAMKAIAEMAKLD